MIPALDFNAPFFTWVSPSVINNTPISSKPNSGGPVNVLNLEILPRKEVIQPHLPVRLPCYDFTPITNPTFNGSLPCGLGHRLRALPAFVV